MLAVEVIVQAELTPPASYAATRAALDIVRRRRDGGVLRVYGLAGAAVCLGRYHLAPTIAPGGAARLQRRLSGGRVMPLGEGFVGIELAIPHRSALVAADPAALRPEQALNRFARALLGGLRGLGVHGFYPGRDAITIERRLVGVLGMESEVDGVTIFEAILALDGDWLRLPASVEAVDPEGTLAVEVPSAGAVTSLAEVAGRPVSLDELAATVSNALGHEFGVTSHPGALRAPDDATAAFDAWLASRRLRPGLDRHGVGWGQLGVLDTYLRLDTAGAIDDVLLAGDFIADSPSVERLEARLRGCALRVDAIEAVVRDVYRDPRSFLLGLGALHTLAETIAEAR